MTSLDLFRLSVGEDLPSPTQPLWRDQWQRSWDTFSEIQISDITL